MSRRSKPNSLLVHRDADRIRFETRTEPAARSCDTGGMRTYGQSPLHEAGSRRAGDRSISSSEAMPSE
jgi:hypothetical protein